MPDDPPRSGTDDISRPETVRSTFDWSSTSACSAVVETVASAIDRDPTALDTLNDQVDTDALDALFRTGPATPPRTTLSVSFTYMGRAVTIDADGHVEVAPLAR